MTNDQYLFLIELLLRDNSEKGLLLELVKNPTDEATRNAYVDFLLDSGRSQSAELIRAGFTPGGLYRHQVGEKKMVSGIPGSGI